MVQLKAYPRSHDLSPSGEKAARVKRVAEHAQR
jgi:hypothetical protein